MSDDYCEVDDWSDDDYDSDEGDSFDPDED